MCIRDRIVTPLASVGLVKSERGSQGGYRLTKAPADYTAGEILRAIEAVSYTHLDVYKRQRMACTAPAASN